MRYLAYFAFGAAFLIPACAEHRIELAESQRAEQFITVVNFTGKGLGRELEQPYRFSAEISGRTRAARIWQTKVRFEREFPEGVAVSEVVQSIQADLGKEFIYEESGKQKAGGSSDQSWHLGLCIGWGIEMTAAEFVPLNLEGPGKIGISCEVWSSQSTPTSS